MQVGLSRIEGEFRSRAFPYVMLGIGIVCPFTGLFASSSKATSAFLLEAAAKGNLESVRTALEQGADVNVRDKERSTPLIRAAEAGHAAIVKFLISKGADVKARTETGSTALLETLVGLGDRIQLEHDTKPIEKISESEETPPETIEVVNLLLAAGADVKRKDQSDQSPLGLAVELGTTALVRIFLEHGADPNQSGMDGSKPLNVAVESGRTEVMQLLLSNGADVNGKDNWGYTPRKILEGQLASARKRMPERGDPDGKIVARLETMLNLVKTAGGKDSSSEPEVANDPATRFFKSLLAHLPDEQLRSRIALKYTPQVLYPYGRSICDSLKKGMSKKSLIEGNMDQFFGSELSEAMVEAAKETTCPELNK
jgi:ankyrin repeat protein